MFSKKQEPVYREYVVPGIDGSQAEQARQGEKRLREAENDRAPAVLTKVSEQTRPATAEVDSTRDHLGRSFLTAPPGIKATSAALSNKPPKKQLYVYKGHESGLQALSWLGGGSDVAAVPPHMLLSADLQGKIMLWDLYGQSRGKRATYCGHQSAIRSLSVAPGLGGTRFSSSETDGVLREWDTETGQALITLDRHSKVAGMSAWCASHCYHPDDPSVIVAGVGKQALLWDTRVNNVARYFDGHLAPLLYVGFLGTGAAAAVSAGGGKIASGTVGMAGGRFFATTSEDKTVRLWDPRSSAPVQDFGDVSMHAIPHFAAHPRDGTVAAQSMDNKIVVFGPATQSKQAGQAAVSGTGRLKPVKDRFFSGHAVSGSACTVSFSPDGKLISSGDVTGKLHVWNYMTGECVKSYQAHSKVLTAHLWHPAEASKIISGSWDGTIKVFT